MANNYKVLGQIRPGAATEVGLYTVPAATQTVISQITANNVGTVNTELVTIAVVPGGGASATANRIISVFPLGPKESVVITGVTMDATDEIRVEGSGGGIVFHAYGQEIT